MYTNLVALGIMAIHGHFVHQLFKFVLSSHTILCVFNSIIPNMLQGVRRDNKVTCDPPLDTLVVSSNPSLENMIGMGSWVLCVVTWDFSILNQELLGPYSHVAAHTYHIFVP